MLSSLFVGRWKIFDKNFVNSWYLQQGSKMQPLCTEPHKEAWYSHMLFLELDFCLTKLGSIKLKGNFNYFALWIHCSGETSKRVLSAFFRGAGCSVTLCLFFHWWLSVPQSAVALWGQCCFSPEAYMCLFLILILILILSLWTEYFDWKRQTFAGLWLMQWC